jgi:hypothetical protein
MESSRVSVAGSQLSVHLLSSVLCRRWSLGRAWTPQPGVAVLHFCRVLLLFVGQGFTGVRRGGLFRFLVESGLAFVYYM